MAISVNLDLDYQDSLEVVNLESKDNLLVVKVDDPAFNYKIYIENNLSGGKLKFQDLKFKPNRLHEEKINHSIMMNEGKVIAGYKLELSRIIYNAETGIITEIAVDEVNLKFEDESLIGKLFDYKTRYSNTVFNVGDLMKRVII